MNYKMMENTTVQQQIPTLNEVDGFSPAAFTRAIPNDDGSTSMYLDVKFRMLWFRLRHPNGKLDTEVMTVTDQYAVVICRVYTDRGDPVDQYIAKATAQRFTSQEKFGDRFLETAETAAIGRALAAAGFGTQFCSPADMLSGVITDAPVELSMLTGEEEDNGAVASRVVHETFTPQQSAPAPAPAPAPQSRPAPQPPISNEKKPPVQRPEPKTAEEMAEAMTLDEAKNVKVEFGRYAGNTLGQIAMFKPADLQWYVDHYSGSNKAIKAGAMVLLREAQKMAS
jgi:hypothetical protein